MRKHVIAGSGMPLVAIRALEGVGFADGRDCIAKGATGNFDRKTAEELVKHGKAEFVGIRGAARDLVSAGACRIGGKFTSEQIQDMQAEGLTVVND